MGVASLGPWHVTPPQQSKLYSMFHLAIATPGRDTGLAVGVAVDEPFLRLKTSVVSVLPELGLVLVIKSTSHRNT